MNQYSCSEQAATNKEDLEKQIEVCTLKEQFGSTEAAKIITQRGRSMGRTTVCQIYTTYQVLQASTIIQHLFKLGKISWNDIYKTRGVYVNGIINTNKLSELENKLLVHVGITRGDIQNLIQSVLITESYSSTNDHYKNLEEEVQKSRFDKAGRRRRLKIAPKKPEIIEITHTVFKRNPDVIAEALERAKGFCEYCKKAAPFVRKSDNSPFLEVHHITPLAQDGDDTVENAIALCPNCHREKHYGV